MAKKQKSPAVEAQDRYRETHMNVDKERAQFIFSIGTKEGLKKVAARYGFKTATPFLEALANDPEKFLQKPKKGT
jgi:hypothetical protein